MSKKPPAPLQFSRRQALALGLSVGLFLCFLLTTFVALKIMPLLATRAGGGEVAATSAPAATAPALVTPTAPGRSRFQLGADEVNLTVPLAPGVAEEGLAAGQFVELILSWRPAGEAPMQATLHNLEVVAVDPPAPPDRPLPVATLRLKRRDAEQFSRRRAEPDFRCRLVVVAGGR